MTTSEQGQLADVLRAEGGLLGAALPDAPETHEAARATSPPSADGELLLAVEAIREGYRLHYDHPRVLAAGGDPDLDLLAGDRLYALGLERLATLGNLHAIKTLAEVIAESARAHAAGDPERAAQAWATGTRAVVRQVGDP